MNLSVLDNRGQYVYDQSAFIDRCLVLNRKPKKISHAPDDSLLLLQWKLQSFNLDPFPSMSVVFLPKILGLITRAKWYCEDDCDSENEVGLNAVFRLVMIIPDSSNVSSRSDVGVKRTRIQSYLNP